MVKNEKNEELQSRREFFKKAAKGLTRFLSAPVRVKTVKGKNKIEIQFKDEEELQRILHLIEESAESSSDQS